MRLKAATNHREPSTGTQGAADCRNEIRRRTTSIVSSSAFDEDETKGDNIR
jgi:hypothetical protein